MIVSEQSFDFYYHQNIFSVFQKLSDVFLNYFSYNSKTIILSTFIILSLI